MADKIITEFITLDDITGGDVYFGFAESYQIRFLAREIHHFKKSYPGLPLFCSDQGWNRDIARWCGRQTFF